MLCISKELTMAFLSRYLTHNTITSNLTSTLYPISLGLPMYSSNPNLFILDAN